LNVQTAEGEDLLMLAAINNQLWLADKLISKGADVNKPGWTALHYAASKGWIEMMRLLLDQQAYLDAESPNGTTPLMMAAGYGSPMAVKLLLEEGADPRIRNKRGLTALDMAKPPEKLDAKRYIQAFLVAWEQKYTKPDGQNTGLIVEQSVPESDDNETQVTPESVINAVSDASVNVTSTQTVQTATPEAQTPEIVAPAVPVEVVSKPPSQVETPPMQQSRESDPQNPEDDELMEAITGPGLQTTTIETQPVQPVEKLTNALPVSNPQDQGSDAIAIENKPKLNETVKEVLRKAGTSNAGVVRVKPLEPNNTNTSYTKQLQTRRVVTVDIIEVNNDESKSGQ
jgi:hypothetical protein